MIRFFLFCMMMFLSCEQAEDQLSFLALGMAGGASLIVMQDRKTPLSCIVKKKGKSNGKKR